MNNQRQRLALATFALATLALAAISTAALAQPAAPPAAASRVFANPPAARPEAEAKVAPHAFNALLVAAPAPAVALQTTDTYDDPRQNILYNFSIEFTDGKIHNPWTGADDAVRLRSYHGSQVDPTTPFLAPTITMRPGQTVRIHLANNLIEKDAAGHPIPPAPCAMGDINVPHCFNDTNLHAHGLWVSPTGNSDNVLISINPGVAFDYEYDVPSDHPAGTFWYHPHKHGSTALQVSSGMDGALIIKDDRAPTETTPGDLDILLVGPDGKALEEKVLIFQQVQYACFIPDPKDPTKQIIRVGPDGKWACNPGEVGVIRSYNEQFSPQSTWANSGRFTSINGRVQPEIGGLQAGRFERWRLIHGGVREAVDFTIRAVKKGAPDFSTVKGADQRKWIIDNCVGQAVPMWEVALDGLTRSQVRTTGDARLQPGYRADEMVYFPAGGDYCVLDAGTDAKGSPSGFPEDTRILAIAKVANADTPKAEPEHQLQTLMIEAAKHEIAAGPVQDRVVKDLQDGMKLSAFVWHKTITDAELNPVHQDLTFNIITNQTPTLFFVNGKAYDPDRIDRSLKLGDAEQWDLTSALAGHPFHIHVNPFQVVSVTDDKGNDVTDKYSKFYDADYGGMIGQWKDTLFVKQNYHISVRTRYERYIGEYVLHCHILDHEDQGMMQNVKISIPDGFGGVADAHHHSH